MVIAARKGIDDDNSSGDEVSQDDTCGVVSQMVKFTVQAGSHI